MADYNTRKDREMLRQRIPRPTSNPIVSDKPDVFLEFDTSKLGIRVRGGDDKMGLYVAAITNDAPEHAKGKIPDGAQIISVNGVNLENMLFDKAVEHFAQLSLPISVQFRPPLYPPKKKQPRQLSYNPDHDHYHHNDDDEADGTCYVCTNIDSNN